MTATIKLRGGPLSNRYETVDSLGERFLVTKPRRPTLADYSADPFYAPLIEHEQGFYAKTNIRTKRGAYVFQWMGWEGEVIAR
jgi:hypothetical protein